MQLERSRHLLMQDMAMCLRRVMHNVGRNCTLAECEAMTAKLYAEDADFKARLDAATLELVFSAGRA